MGKVTEETLLCVIAGLPFAFREAGVFIRVDREMHRLPAYFDNHDCAGNNYSTDYISVTVPLLRTASRVALDNSFHPDEHFPASPTLR